MFQNYIPTRLIFGDNTLDTLADYVNIYGNKVLLLGPKMNQAIKPMFQRIEKILQDNNIKYYSFYDVEPNPSSNTVDLAFALAKKQQVDCIIAMGGGSVIDVSKIIKVFIDQEKLDWPTMFTTYTSPKEIYPMVSKNPLPLIAISTTAGTGSECTQASVITNSLTEEKLTIFHPNSFPDIALVDPVLHQTLPAFIAQSTAFDAFTHAFESYLNNEDNPLMESYQLLAIKLIVENLENTWKNNDHESRKKLALASTLAGISLANCGAKLPHPMSEIIGSSIKKLSHGQALALVYPSFIKHTSEKYMVKYAKICRVFNSNYELTSDKIASISFYEVLQDFLVKNNLILKLKDYATKQEINEIKNLKVWQHLPMEETKVIEIIIGEICED